MREVLPQAQSAGPGGALLEARGLTLRVGERRLLNDLSFEMRRGELWCVLGPNGCGKTTLLLALAGLQRPAGGEVLLGGRALRDWPLAEAARVRGFLPQTVHDAFSATVLETVVIGRHPHLPSWRWEDDRERAVAQHALQQVDLAPLAGRDVLTLSGGERQRAAIATVLAQDPALMLLDEPASHLDLRHQSQVMRHFVALARQGKAIALSLHDVNLAARYASHALVFVPGGEAVLGPAPEVLTEAVLSLAYARPLHRLELNGRPVFVPGEA